MDNSLKWPPIFYINAILGVFIWDEPVKFTGLVQLIPYFLIKISTVCYTTGWADPTFQSPGCSRSWQAGHPATSYKHNRNFNRKQDMSRASLDTQALKSFSFTTCQAIRQTCLYACSTQHWPPLKELTV